MQNDIIILLKLTVMILNQDAGPVAVVINSCFSECTACSTISSAVFFYCMQVTYNLKLSTRIM